MAFIKTHSASSLADCHSDVKLIVFANAPTFAKAAAPGSGCLALYGSPLFAVRFGARARALLRVCRLFAGAFRLRLSPLILRVERRLHLFFCCLQNVRSHNSFRLRLAKYGKTLDGVERNSKGRKRFPL